MTACNIGAAQIVREEQRTKFGAPDEGFANLGRREMFAGSVEEVLFRMAGWPYGCLAMSL